MIALPALPALVTLSLVMADPPADRPADPPDDPGDLERVHWDSPDAQGRLTGGYVLLPRPDLGAVRREAAEGGGVAGVNVVTLQDNGPPGNRIDVVLVGDGYTEAGLGVYAVHAGNVLDDLFDEQPFASYQSFFNVHRVDVVSNESGVDNDPVQGIDRDTALDMYFWCGGIERLLCLNVSKAYAFAVAAPDADQVFAVGNSTKYGGAGYMSSDLATYAGGNGSAPEIAIHEIGHSLGDLADEYDYNDNAVYQGSERPERNVSIMTAAEMAASGQKWSAWLDVPGVSTYEGAYYHEFGIYRPTVHSKMRTLGYPFNAPSVEGFIIEFYKLVSPIDGSTPPGTLDGSETVFVEPVHPSGHPLDITWSIDGEPLPAAGPEIDLASLAIDPGAYTLSVTVADPTDLVRDESARSLWMTATLDWTLLVEEPACLADVTGDGVVDVVDLIAVISGWGDCGSPCPGDVDGDGTVDVADLTAVVSGWGPC